MADECIEFRKIENRCSELREWISSRAPHCVTDQKHLQEGSEQRGYWAHGYLTALLDVIQLFSREVPNPGYGNGEASSTRYAA
jgi:hypothetical protein